MTSSPLLPTIFDLCAPREDVAKGTSSDADFAANLARVLRGGADAPVEYADPARFFANTFPTRGLKDLLRNVCGRLSGMGGSVAAIFRLDTTFGGGKTHGLITLVHAARGMKGVAQPEEFLDPGLLPKEEVRIAAFDGENADPANGRRMAPEVLAYTPWGEIAYALAGREGYERVRRSDETGVAPGAETLAELFGGKPALILMDELAIYLRKVANRPGAKDQLTAFLTALFTAVESSPKAALVYTLAVGKDGRAGDAYSEENQFVADRMAEAMSVSARKATLLNPTEDDETVQVLLRRLFSRVDKARVPEVVTAYKEAWSRNREALALEAAKPKTLEDFAASYPLHPEVLETLTSKTATLADFQRVRGMLRLLGRTVQRLWQEKPADAHAIHLHHIDPGFEPIRMEITTRLGQTMYVPAIRSDVAGEGGTLSLGQDIDAKNHKGLPPFATYVARTILMHTLAFNDALKGLSPERLRYAVMSPSLDLAFVEEARKAFVSQSAYLDDRPGAPMRFLVEANLTQIIRREEQSVDPGEVRSQLNDLIKSIFKGQTLEMVPFPSGPWEVPDEVGEGKPLLVVMSPDAVSVGALVEDVPELIARIYERKGSDGTAYRLLRNNLLFVVAEDGRVDAMRAKMMRRLALRALKSPSRLGELAEHQQATVREHEAKSEAEAAIAIQQCFRHIFFPSNLRIGSSAVSLTHTALEVHGASEKPGAGQQQVVRQLREARKLRTSEDEPDAPAYVRDRTPLRKGQITTAALREQFRQDATLPMLVGDDVFVRGIRLGVDRGEFVYRKSDLLYGKGDPHTPISVEEEAVVFTMAYAVEHNIWPRAEKKAAQGTEGAGGGAQGGTSFPQSEGQAGGAAEAGAAPPIPGDGSSGTTTATAPQKELLHAEGVLKEALNRIFEQAAARKVSAISRLTVRVFEPADGFRLLGVVSAVRTAEVRASIKGEFETVAGSTVMIGFEGVPQDALPLRDFLDPQLKLAAEKDVSFVLSLGYKDGLPTSGEAPTKLIEQLTRFVTGAAYVEATAEPKP
ncbi:MAG: ATP-binding protein [Roseomonas sp.]|nr:ATP-binding protein [Roseomonas sp.]MCA4908174.1 ATP-binding protein [Roseomonas sp.]